MKRNIFQYKINNPSIWKDKLIQYAFTFPYATILNSNNYKNDPYSKYDFIAAFTNNPLNIQAVNPFESIQNLYTQKKDWLFGYWSYDTKNLLEKLQSNNFDGIQAPEFCFFIPDLVVIQKENFVEIHYHTSEFGEKEIYNIIQNIENTNISDKPISISGIQARIDKSTYLETIKKIQHHIQIGDIYELNYCQDFFTHTNSFDATTLYQKLNRISPTPYSCLGKWGQIEVMCASPERFLCKRGSKIISQPIKGTIKRGTNPQEDKILKNKLYNSKKDRSENVMIVDLVRNDLSKTAKKGSVYVKELFGIYEFPQVHQMISTICSEIATDNLIFEVISNAFPMGSMTGAPKIKAMELIENFESFKRGIYSGSIGYVDPEGDMDFNVVIRSLIHNSQNNYLTFAVGGAITIQSSAEEEYEETLLKAKALFELFK